MASAGPAAGVAEGRYTREFTHTEIKEELENIFGGKKFDVEDANAAASVIQRAAKKWLWRLRVRKVAKEYRESDEGKRQRKRGMIAAEILSTEDSYVRSLQQLVECFYRPMCALAEHESHNRFRSPAATMEDVQVIFSNIVIIFEFQTTFLAQLREEYNHWPEKPQCIGAVFVRMGAFLKLYTEFSNNFQASLDRIDACMRRKGFKQWLEEAEAKCKLPMNSLLIMPIQRTPRYRLLLQELLKYTTDDHVDFDNLTKGLEKIKDVASYINETKRSAERGEIVLQKQMMIRGLDLNLVHPNRYFVNMGHLVRMTKDGAPENRTFFLFNDMLLATKPDPHSKLFNYDGYVLIRGAVVHTFPDKKKTIVIEFPRINRKITYKADSQETKEKWVTWLKEALTDIDGQPSDSASDLLLEPEHFSGGTTKKAGYLHYSENGLAATKTKRYWFCLEQGVLLCYSPKKRNLKRSFQLENFKIRAVEGAHLPLIELYTPDVSSHIIVAANAKQQQQWIKVLTSSKIYEDLPITGLALIHLDQGELAPLGFTPVMRTWYGNSANLNAEAGGRDIRLCYERNGKDAEGNPKPPITSLSLIFVDGDGLFRRRWSAEVLPANKGWHQVSKTAYGKSDGNVNHGSGGREAYLLYKTEPHKPAITSVSLYYEQEGVVTPDGFTPVFYTVSGKYRADLNKGTKKGVPIVLCFKTEDDEELFVQSKLGYVPGKGIDEGRMNPSWKKLLEDAKVPLSDLKTMDDAKFVVQEAAACMDQLSAEKVLKAETAKLSCYKCKSVFLFHKSSKYVKCPSCGSTNLAPGSSTSVKSDSSKLRKMAEQQPQPEVTLLHSTQQPALQQQPMRQQQQQPQQQPQQQQPLQQPVQMQQMQQAPQQPAQLQQQASGYYSSQPYPPPPQQHSVPQFGAQQSGGNAGQYGSQYQPPQSVPQAAYGSSAYGSQAPLVPSLPGHLPSQQPPPSYGSSLQPQVPFAPYSPSYGGSSPYNSAASYSSGAPSPGPSSPYSSAVRPLQQIPQYAPPFQSQYGHQVAPGQGYGGPSAYQSAATPMANPSQAYQQPYQSGYQQPQQPAYQQPQQQAQQPQQYYQQPYQSVQMRQPAPQQAQQAPPQQLQQPPPMVRVSSTAAGIDDMSEIPTGEVIADAPSEANGKLKWEDLSAEDYEKVAGMLQQRMEQKRSGLEDFALI